MYRPDHFKMVLLGKSGSGKSSLALRFAKEKYQENMPNTVGAAFFTHVLQLDPETSLKIDLWDTAGQERFHALAPMYYRGAQAALIVYDITAYDSLRDAKMWVKELREANGADMVIGLIGNKVDLETENKRQVDTREASEYAEENGLIFMETSAKRGDNVTEIFMNVARQVATKQQINTLNKPRGTFSPSKSESQKSSICCNSSTTE